MTIARLHKTILDWYKQNKRDLPWRNTQDPYKILVSEIMLQQTQIPRVLPKYEEFLKEFPSFEALGKEPEARLMKVWAGLGYWRRAKYLKETAKILVKARESSFQASSRRPLSKVPEGVTGRERRPQNSAGNFEGRSLGTWTPERLEQLPGIGHYTARALACFAFGSKEAFLDTNIRRVYLHFFFDGKNGVPDKEILPIAQKAIDTLPKSISAREWHYALFDYGAVVLKKDHSINKRSLHYHKQSKFEGSFRSFRTKAFRFILEHPKNKVSRHALHAFLAKELADSSYTSDEVIQALFKDKLIKSSKTHYSL